MGVDNYFYLFNLTTYQKKVSPAYRKFFMRGEVEPLILLVEELIATLHTKPKPSRDLYLNSRKDYLEAIKILNGDIVLGKDDRRLDNYFLSQIPFLKVKKISPKKQFAKNWLGRDLVSGLCVPHDKKITPVINMMNRPLINYLYHHSTWMENFFCGGREEVINYLKDMTTFEYSPGYFKKKDIETFRSHFLKVPIPQGVPEIKKLYGKKNGIFSWTDEGLEHAAITFLSDYKHLKQLLDIATQDPDLTILEILQ